MRARAVLLAIAALSLSGAPGCAPTMTTLQPSTVPARGTTGGGLGAATSIPTGSIMDVLDAGADAAGEVEAARRSGDPSQLDKEDVVALVKGGGASLLALPAVTGTVMLKYAFLPGWEGGIRGAGSSTSIFVRNQLLHRRRHGIDGTWGASLGRASFEYPLGELEPLQLSDFTRTEIEGHFFFGWSSQLGHVWFGPKLVITSYESGARVEITQTCNPTADLTGGAGYLSGALGGAIGWRHAWLALEVTTGYAAQRTTVKGSLNCQAISPDDQTFEEDVDESGVIVGVEAGVIVQF